MRTKDDLKKKANLANGGSKDAFSKIYNSLFDQIYKFVYFRVDSHEEAEDITQETFIKAWNKIETYKDVGLSIEAWVYRIARNTLIDFYRTKKKAETIDEHLHLTDDKPTPEEVFLQNELKLEIYTTLKFLKTSYREAVVLRFINDLSYSEIAQILQKPEDQVRVLVSRAIKTLREKINEKNTN